VIIIVALLFGAVPRLRRELSHGTGATP